MDHRPYTMPGEIEHHKMRVWTLPSGTGVSYLQIYCRGRALSRPVYRKLGTRRGRKGTEPLPYGVFYR